MLTIDRTSYGEAADLFIQANQTVATIASRLFDALIDAAISAGEGEGARTWCTSYEQAAGSVAPQISDLIDAFGNTATLLDASGRNHARAEAAAAPYGLSPDPSHPPDLVGVSLSGVPAMYGGNSDEPWGWSLVAGHLEGFAWPGADLDRIRTLAAAWHTTAGDLQAATYFSAAANGALDTMNSPELPSAIEVCERLADACLNLASDCDTLGNACTAYADAVSQARANVKHAFKELLGAAGVGAGVSIGAALLSGGLSTLVEGALGDFLEGTIAGIYISRIIASLETLSGTLGTLNPALAINDARSGQSAWLRKVANAVPVMAAVEVEPGLLATELDVVGPGSAPWGGMTDAEIIERGWANRDKLADHFKRHASDVGAITQADYVQAAQELLQRSRTDGLPTKIDARGNILVFDPASGLFGVYRSDGRARTIFRPSPDASGYWSEQRGEMQ